MKDLDGVKDENEDLAQDNMDTTSHIVDMIYKETSKSDREASFTPQKPPFEVRRESGGVSTVNNSIENLKSQ